MKKVLITGASKGIGYATALEFIKEGHKVMALARNKGLLLKLKKEAGDNLIPMVADLSGPIDSASIKDRLEEIDILMHNAGYLVNKPFVDITQEDLQKSYEVNLIAPFRLTQKLLPLLNKEAHVLMVGSVGGVTGSQKFPGLSAYSSSKAALSCLAECLQAEFAETDLTFNSLALGAVQTEMLEEAFPGYQAPVNPLQMAKYIVDFALTAPSVIKGKTMIVSKSNP